MPHVVNDKISDARQEREQISILKIILKHTLMTQIFKISVFVQT